MCVTTQELKERTFEFGIRVVPAVESLPRSDVAREIGRQLLRAGTSVGANYRAVARADFAAKLGIVEEESDEAAYWMEVIIALKLLRPSRLAKLHAEAGELLAIIVASIKTARRAPRS
jgi:four helix bundle protein